MSSIRVIRQQIRPWKGRDCTAERYYVNDWVDRIQHELLIYASNNPKTPSLSLLRNVGKVWYDINARCHVDGVFSESLRRFIVHVMEDTQFLESEYATPYGTLEVIDWISLINDIPVENRNGINVFKYRGCEYFVECGYYEHARQTILAYRLLDGTVDFETESVDLTELVLRLIADNGAESSNTEFYDCVQFRLFY